MYVTENTLPYSEYRVSHGRVDLLFYLLHLPPLARPLPSLPGEDSFHVLQCHDPVLVKLQSQFISVRSQGPVPQQTVASLEYQRHPGSGEERKTEEEGGGRGKERMQREEVLGTMGYCTGLFCTVHYRPVHSWYICLLS